MAKIDFNSKLKVSVSNNTEIPFDEDTHIDVLPVKDRVLIALALGLGISATVREYNINGNSGFVVGNTTLEAVCNKFGILA